MIAVFLVTRERYRIGFVTDGEYDTSISVHKIASLNKWEDLRTLVIDYLHENGLGIGPDFTSNYNIIYNRRWVTIISCLHNYIIAIDADKIQYGVKDNMSFNIELSKLIRYLT